jgi:signal transduction histidine kinase
MFSMLSRLLRTESFRLTAVFVGIILAAMLTLMALVYAITHEAFRAELHASIDHGLASVEDGYNTEGISEAKEVIQQRLFRSGGTDFFLLETASQKKLAGNMAPMAPVEGLQRIAMPHSKAGEGEDHEIVGKGRFLAPDLYVFVGRDLFIANAAEESVLRAFGWVLAATLLVALIGGFILSKSFLGRMDAITMTCRSIMAGHLSDRIPERGTRDEFDQLAHTINAMLNRIVALMDNIQQISGDIAHDLRTPLTRLRHRLEAVHSESSNIEDYRLAVEQVIDESETILGTFSALLRIGQIESGTAGIPLEDVDLSGLLTELAEIYGPAAEDGGHSLETSIAPGVTVSGDRAMLSQVFVNLIENAMTHSPSGGSIGLSLCETQSRVIAAVSDSGLGIPPEEHERVFRRFYRLERSRSTPGSGLGLSLVGAITRYHSAQVELRDNCPGLRVEVQFDRAKSDQAAYSPDEG